MKSVLTNFLLAVLFMPVTTAWPATYYVDYAGGADSNTGDSAALSFRHSPGDPAAKDKAAAVELQPGDTVLFKGGVLYRGNIVCRQSGAEGKPITYAGNTAGKFGAGRAIIDGSESLEGWKKCASPEECDGNPHWKAIWWTQVPYVVADPKTANLYQDQKPLFVAQDPAMKYPWEPDSTKEYLPFDPAHATKSSIQDEKYLTQTDPHAWDGAFVGVRVPDAWFFFKITGFDPAAHRITFQENTGVLGGRKGPNGESQYCMLNGMANLNRPGLYVVRVQDKKSKIYLWPPESDTEPKGITITRRQVGFNINGQSDLTIEGFWLRKFVNFGSRESGTAVLDDAQKDNGGLVIRDNLITASNRTLGSGKTAAISLTGQNGSLVENNQICDNYGSVGIRILKGSHHVLKGNLICRCGGVGILLWQDCKDCQIVGNTIKDNDTDNLGSHSPVGMLLYKGCRNIRIFGNQVMNNGQRPLALYSPDGDITIACNVFRHRGPYVIEAFGQIKNVKVINNVLICDDPRGRIFQGGVRMETQNNIFIADGPMFDRGTGVKLDDAHNLCAGLSHLDAIFADPAHGDYRLKLGSPAIGAGVATEIRQDAAGAPFPEGKAPDVGAFLYAKN